MNEILDDFFKILYWLSKFCCFVDDGRCWSWCGKWAATRWKTRTTLATYPATIPTRIRRWWRRAIRPSSPRAPATTFYHDLVPAPTIFLKSLMMITYERSGAIIQSQSVLDMFLNEHDLIAQIFVRIKWLKTHHGSIEANDWAYGYFFLNCN